MGSAISLLSLAAALHALLLRIRTVGQKLREGQDVMAVKMS